MAIFVDNDGKEVEVKEAVDIAEWKAAGFKEKGKRGAGRPPKTVTTKNEPKESPKSGGGLIEEDS